MPIARLAAPFTDDDFSGGRVVVVNDGIGDNNVTLPLPSASFTTYDAFYNGGPLISGGSPGTGDTTLSTPNDSLIMQLAEAIFTDAGFHLDVTEDSTMPGRYSMERQGGGSWSIKWDSGSTTLDPAYFGFESATYSSTASVITAPHQAARLWIGQRQTWHASHSRSKTATLVGWSGAVASRQLSSTRHTRWPLQFNAVPGAKVRTWDAADPVLYQAVSGMAQSDPNVPLEQLWQWVARRQPLRYLPDDTAMATEYYTTVAEGLDDVMQVATPQPPTYQFHRIAFELLEYIA